MGNNIKNKKRIDQEGITLIEILLAMAIFGFIVGGIVLFGVRAIEAHTKSQAMQNALENARFAMESLSKRARTSSDITNDGDRVFFIDNASGNSYCYQFDGAYNGSLRVWIGDGESTSNCASVQASPIYYADVVGDSSDDADISVTGSFEVKESNEGAGTRGILRTTLTIGYTGNLGVQSNSSQTVQSTVSLRDY